MSTEESNLAYVTNREVPVFGADVYERIVLWTLKTSAYAVGNQPCILRRLPKSQRLRHW